MKKSIEKSLITFTQLRHISKGYYLTHFYERELYCTGNKRYFSCSVLVTSTSWGRLRNNLSLTMSVTSNVSDNQPLCVLDIVSDKSVYSGLYYSTYARNLALCLIVNYQLLIQEKSRLSPLINPQKTALPVNIFKSIQCY